MAQFKKCSCGTENPIDVKNCRVCGDDISQVSVQGIIEKKEKEISKKSEKKTSKKKKHK